MFFSKKYTTKKESILLDSFFDYNDIIKFVKIGYSTILPVSLLLITKYAALSSALI